MKKAFPPSSVSPREVFEQVTRVVTAADSNYRAVISLASEFRESTLGALSGVPILVKDNIDTKELPTTVGSSLFAGEHAPSNAAVVDDFERAGATIVGKANLSEWANFRGAPSISGWSAVGGLTVNPFDSSRSAGGSSSGSAVAVALGYVPCAVGTETDGSIICPASLNGVVGFKPTPGWISTQGVVPISRSQDSVGFFTRTVRDLAVILEGLYGHTVRCASQVRLAYPVETQEMLSLPARTLFQEAIESLSCNEIQVVPVESPYFRTLAPDGDQEFALLVAEFADGITSYLSQRALPGLQTLEDLIAANERSRERELTLFGQEIFEAARAPVSATRLRTLRRGLKSRARQAVTERLSFVEADALLVPAMNPAWLIDTINGDPESPSGYGVAAVGRLPSITLPMGLVRGLPCGLCLVGKPGGDVDLLEAATLVSRQLDVTLFPPVTPGPFSRGGWSLESDTRTTVFE